MRPAMDPKQLLSVLARSRLQMLLPWAILGNLCVLAVNRCTMYDRAERVQKHASYVGRLDERQPACAGRPVDE